MSNFVNKDNPFHVSGQNNDLSTITELRSKGEARRFLDEMGYLFEGLEPGMAPSVLRSRHVFLIECI